MKVKYNFDKCILCLKNKPDSWEHILPTSIGGRLQAKLLCSNCNNTLGSEIISKVKTNPSIRLAISNLKNEIPELFERIENHQIYISKDKNKNLIKLKYKNSKLKIIGHKKENGSLVIDTKRGINIIKHILEEEGFSKDKIANKIRSFKKLENNKIIQLSKTLKVIKRSLEKIYPLLRSPLLDKKFIILISYEFISLLIGDLIYDNEFDFIREFIKRGEKSEKIVIENLTSRKYNPYHMIYPELLETEIIINIILFDWLLYKVHLSGFRLLKNDLVYFEDLKNKKTLIAESVNDAKCGIFYES